MRTTIQTWGNSLALRIPKAMSEDLGIKKDAAVDLAVQDGLLVVTPRSGRRARLKKMLALITPENMPEEREPFGKRVGREAW
jgi:antitoxin MazE